MTLPLWTHMKLQLIYQGLNNVEIPVLKVVISVKENVTAVWCGVGILQASAVLGSNSAADICGNLLWSIIRNFRCSWRSQTFPDTSLTELVTLWWFEKTCKPLRPWKGAANGHLGAEKDTKGCSEVLSNVKLVYIIKFKLANFHVNTSTNVFTNSSSFCSCLTTNTIKSTIPLPL